MKKQFENVVAKEIEPVLVFNLVSCSPLSSFLEEVLYKSLNEFLNESFD